MAKISARNAVAFEPRANNFSTLGATPYTAAPVPFSVRGPPVNEMSPDFELMFFSIISCRYYNRSFPDKGVSGSGSVFITPFSTREPSLVIIIV